MANDSALDVVTVGETMVQFNPLDEGRLSHASLFERHVGGSESNVAIGLSRLGFRAAHVTKLGKDEFSRLILSTLKAEGVRTDWIKLVDGKTCGIFFVQRNFPFPRQSDVVYYRNDSAAKLLTKEDIMEVPIATAKILHISGITLAISESSRQACLEAIKIAKQNRVTFSFDTNFRRKIWSEEQAGPVLKDAASKADILFTGPDDCSIMLGGRKGVWKGDDADEEFILNELSDMGPEKVVLKLGPQKGLVAVDQSNRVRSSAIEVPLVDSIGAGDAVVAGFLAGVLWNESLQKSLDMASCCSALVVMRRGDFENLPHKEQLDMLLSKKNSSMSFGVDLR